MKLTCAEQLDLCKTMGIFFILMAIVPSSVLNSLVMIHGCNKSRPYTLSHPISLTPTKHQPHFPPTQAQSIKTHGNILVQVLDD